MPFDPKQLSFSPTHEWVHLESGPGGEKIATVGLSDFALKALTDLVHIDLPQSGRQVTTGKPLGEVESVKAVSDLYSPVNGEIVEVNSSLVDNLEVLNEDPYGAGWLVKIRLSDATGMDRLLDYSAYQKQVEEESH